MDRSRWMAGKGWAARTGACLVMLAGALQGCSSSQPTSVVDPYGRNAPQQNAAQQRAPTSFDVDGPAPAAAGVYRGGRDPVTGKAPEWSGGGGQVQTSSIPPAPPKGRATAGAPMVRQAPASSGASSGSGLQGMAIVRQGDTLDSIAQAHGVSASAIQQANKLSGRAVKPGQRLVIPQ